TTGHHATIVNDADAAGYAEVRYGAARGQDGVVLVLTLGTGIGSALINDGRLVPNTELGHLEIDGYDAETRAASSVKDREGPIGTTGHHATIVNDADAAGYAEVRYGAARGQDGVVLVLTLGTGIGSALINDGRLVPNTELGHLEIDGYDAETRAASSVKDREG